MWCAVMRAKRKNRGWLGFMNEMCKGELTINHIFHPTHELVALCGCCAVFTVRVKFTARLLSIGGSHHVITSWASSPFYWYFFFSTIAIGLVV